MADGHVHRLKADSGPDLRSAALKQQLRSGFDAHGFEIRSRPFARGSFRFVHYVRYGGRRLVGKVLIEERDEECPEEEKAAMAAVARQYLAAELLVER